MRASMRLGHARPSITLDRYGHLSKKGLAPLMEKVDALVVEVEKSVSSWKGSNFVDITIVELSVPAGR